MLYISISKIFVKRKIRLKFAKISVTKTFSDSTETHFAYSRIFSRSNFRAYFTKYIVNLCESLDTSHVDCMRGGRIKAFRPDVSKKNATHSE